VPDIIYTDIVTVCIVTWTFLPAVVNVEVTFFINYSGRGGRNIGGWSIDIDSYSDGFSIKTAIVITWTKVPGIDTVISRYSEPGKDTCIGIKITVGFIATVCDWVWILISSWNCEVQPLTFGNCFIPNWCQNWIIIWNLDIFWNWC